MGKIVTTGQLRAKLASAIEQVEAGTMKCETASAINKLASQINESIYAEIKTKRLQLDMGFTAQDISILGNMGVGDEAKKS